MAGVCSEGFRTAALPAAIAPTCAASARRQLRQIEGKAYQGADEEEHGEVERRDEQGYTLRLRRVRRAHDEVLWVEARALGLHPLLNVVVSLLDIVVHRPEIHPAERVSKIGLAVQATMRTCLSPEGADLGRRAEQRGARPHCP